MISRIPHGALRIVELEEIGLRSHYADLIEILRMNRQLVVVIE